MYQNVQLFIRSKIVILNVAIFKHSLRKFRETTLHRKYQLIQVINKKLSYRKETVRLLHNIEIRILH